MKVKLGSRFPAAFFLTLALFAVAAAQEATAPAQNNPAPKKSNARPNDSQAPQREPFDDATAEKMASQCVRLETEAGAIEIEMLAEVAPETVRNFLNLSAIGAFDT